MSGAAAGLAAHGLGLPGLTNDAETMMLVVLTDIIPHWDVPRLDLASPFSMGACCEAAAAVKTTITAFCGSVQHLIGNRGLLASKRTLLY